MACNRSLPLPDTLSVMKAASRSPSNHENGDLSAGGPGLDPGRVAQALIEWFPGAARDLPWRRQRSGYHGLVSEAMLQQTQVSRVVPAFLRFIERFPTVEDLAEAPEEDVVACWQGLGYYRRARNLHAAARMVVDSFGGLLPTDLEDLLRLPGVGRYTAGALASIVHGLRAPIVDGNVVRVLARVAANPGTPGERDFESWAWDVATEFAEVASEPGVANEALMELGALVCTRHDPNCARCPLREECRAVVRGEPQLIPPPRRAVARKTIHHHLVLVRRDDQVLLVRREDRGLWAGMWAPPAVEAPRHLDHQDVFKGVPADVDGLRPVSTFQHRTTHRDVVFHVHEADSGEPSTSREARWQHLDRLGDIGISNPHLKAIGLLSRPAVSHR